MKRNYYVLSSGKLVRKNNTFYFEEIFEDQRPEFLDDREEECLNQISELEIAEGAPEAMEPKKIPRKPIPVEDIEALFIFGELTFNKRFLNYAATKGILIHFYNYYGFYTGSFIPRETNVSGKLTVRQAEHYGNLEKRRVLASQFVLGAAKNILKNLAYYGSRGSDLTKEIENINSLAESVPDITNIKELMGLEGNIRQIYYSCWEKILTKDFEFGKRSKRPPENPLNALISFGNSLVYNTVLSELYKTQLNPLISFLHEPGTARYSLSLDLAEIFKPLLTDRIIFSTINKGMIKPGNFMKELNFCYLKEAGRKVFIKEYDEKLKTTIKHRTLKRRVSFRQLIRLEAYKIIKHLLGDEEYKPFVIWW
ncbi:MAG: type I-B CRISPR-associated endonuclease Cas1b [Ignavibacteriales bacterium]|nr:MAG: type I-B CRISPR-associated endonuclease Cas1 [Ignavibacteriaceae bacterium]MBW7873772.1 type I-B CRISPR-associated endonuclease Cas1 [Ignavibacteria bacterium]MCZ2143078.1 type I-B CRISPR-associated endonuclease Cas1b [Ignavibacteriales bacterium]OQY70641.1 MAG: subtype I-B CRISPR-associated endonuclease Cas1 [Ignavibacteriales bacterium UTCHB3]MBV6445749.1 CRISPR-associated endonuclease Cas1 [Ignavibacteriaceae bacterium]